MKVLRGSFGKRFFVPVFSVIFIFTMVLFFAMNWIVLKLVYKNVDIRLVNKLDEIERLIDKEAEENLAIASLFSRNLVVQKAYEIAYKGDIHSEDDPYLQKAREFLRKELAPIVEGYKEVFGRSLKIHFHLPPARSLLRFWRKKQTIRYGKWVDISDDISSFRKGIVALNSGALKYIKGIEIGRAGLVIRGACRVYDKNGEPVGSVEVLSDISNIFRSIDLAEEDNVGVYMGISFLKIALKLKSSQKLEVFNNRYVLVYSSDSKLFERLFSDVNFGGKLDSHSIDTIGFYRVIVSPIKDYSGKKIGMIAYARNLYYEFAFLRKIKWYIIIFSSMLGFSAFFGIYFVTKRVNKKIKELLSVLTVVSTGDFSKTIPVKKYNCSSILNCGKEDCPLYGKSVYNCFLKVGSYAPSFGREILCPSIVKGEYKDCTECPVYKRIVKDEIDLIKVYFNEFIEIQKDFIGFVMESSLKLFDGSSMLRESSSSLLEGVQHQASSLEEVSSTAEEVFANIEAIHRSMEYQKNRTQGMFEEVNSFVEGAKEANSNINIAMESVENVIKRYDEGSILVKKAVESMMDIRNSTSKITEIVKVISDISNEVNLLSLNASIEAARAGEYGKGFGVVASEISKLADSTAQSASEITELISRGEEYVKNGIDVINRVKSFFEGILSNISVLKDMYSSFSQYTESVVEKGYDLLNGINELKEISKEVSYSMLEQKNANEELNNAVNSINQQSQEFVQIVDNLKSMAENIDSIASKMKEMIKRYKL